MKMIDTASTTSSNNLEFDQGKISLNNISRDTMLRLLKLVHFERKTTKQAANYLKIDYSTAKKILRKFRKNKIRVEDYEGKHTKLLKNLQKQERIENKEENQLSGVLEQLNTLSYQMSNLITDINQNQLTINFFVQTYSKLFSN
jgi:transposase